MLKYQGGRQLTDLGSWYGAEKDTADSSVH